MKWQGSGERGVKLPLSVSEAVYKAEWTEEDLIALIQLICETVEVPSPKIFFMPPARIQWGRYWGDNKKRTWLIRLNKRWVGVVIHEVSHHIEYVRTNRVYHDKKFYQVCSLVWAHFEGLVNKGQTEAPVTPKAIWVGGR